MLGEHNIFMSRFPAPADYFLLQNEQNTKMGLLIQSIPGLPGGNTRLISSSLPSGKTIYALAGHGEDLSYATMSILKQFGKPKRHQSLPCNLRCWFGISVVLCARPECHRQIRLPSSEKEITVSMFFNRDILCEIERVASRTRGVDGIVPRYECQCKDCQSSFFAGPGVPVDDDWFGEWQKLDGRLLFSFIPATIFDIHNNSRDAVVHYGPSAPYTMITASFAKSLGHNLTPHHPAQGEKIISLTISFAKPALWSTAHVLHCTVVEHFMASVGILLNGPDLEKLHSRSEYWDRCGYVIRRFQKKAEVIMKGPSLRRGGVAKVTFHAKDGLQHPTWVIFGTKQPYSEISHHFLKTIEPEWAESHEVTILKVEAEGRNAENISFSPVKHLKFACLSRDGENMEGYNVGITLTDWGLLTGRPHNARLLEYGVFDNVLVENGTGARLSLCVMLSSEEGTPNYVTETVSVKLAKLASTGTLTFNFGKSFDVEGKKAPGLVFGAKMATMFVSAGEILEYVAPSCDPDVLDGLCGVCLDGFDGKSASRSLFCCRQRIHDSCWDDVRQGYDKCPYCRAVV